MISILMVSLLASAVLMVASVRSATAASDCDQRCAIRVAVHEVERLGLDAHNLEMEVDEANKTWNKFMAYTSQSQDDEGRALYEQYNNKLQGKDFWVIYFSLKPREGTYHKGGGAAVLIDKQTSVPLLVIKGE